MAESDYTGKWTRFVGCGTNGGTQTEVVLKPDHSSEVKVHKVKGAAHGRGSEFSISISPSITWNNVCE